MAVRNVIFKLQADTAQMRRELEEVKKGIAGIGKTTEETGKKISGLAAVFKNAATSFGTLFAAQQLAQFGKEAVGAVANLESLKISFTTFLGSAKDAEKVLADLEEFSIKTPFTPEQVQNAGRALLAFGEPVDKLQNTLKQIGDIASGTGKDFNELA